MLIGALQAAYARPDHAFPFWTYVENYLRRHFNVTAIQACDEFALVLKGRGVTPSVAAAALASAPAPGALPPAAAPGQVAQGVPVAFATHAVVNVNPCYAFDCVECSTRLLIRLPNVNPYASTVDGARVSCGDCGALMHVRIPANAAA